MGKDMGVAGAWVVSLLDVPPSVPGSAGPGAWRSPHIAQWAAVLIEQIKLAPNCLIGEGFCKAARSKLSRNERSARL